MACPPATPRTGRPHRRRRRRGRAGTVPAHRQPRGTVLRPGPRPHPGGVPVMTAIARLTRADIALLTRAELRKLATTYTFLVTLAIAIAVSVLSVVADAYEAGMNGTAPLGTDASTYQMLKLGAVCGVATLVLGIVAAGGEYRHRTIIPAMLITPRRGALVAAKATAIAIAGVVLSGLTFGVSLATA